MVRKKYAGAVLAVSDEPKTTVSIDPYIHHCCKRCARKRQTRYLPQEIVFQFLLHLPAQLLHDVMSHVCREWSLVIRSPNFIHHHLRNSAGGIIIQRRFSSRNGIYVEMRQGCLEICKFDCGFDSLVWSSCNGLLVISHPTNFDVLYVANALTKQRTNLPPLSTLMPDYSDCGLAFVEASMEYKVVRACGYKNVNLKTQIAVLTIGVDKFWRHIDITHLLLLLPTELRFTSRPLVTGGYVHWLFGNFVLTLNVETETVCRFPRCQSPKVFGLYLPMGSNLSFVHGSEKYFWEVWEMNSVTGEWTLLLSFDFEPLRYTFKGMFAVHVKSVMPLCWLVAREVLVFSIECGQRRIAYDVKTREVQLLELDADISYHIRGHVNSMVWLE